MASINDELTLPCGLVLPNRLVKAATTEGLGDESNWATSQNVNLYKLWATNHNGGGTLITGNIQVDRRYLDRPGNVCIDGPQSDEQLDRLRDLVKAGKTSGTVMIAQLGHPGRQCNATVNKHPIGPSAIQSKATGVPLCKPRAMTLEDIKDVVERFAHAAKICKVVGFDGVQIHAAHGYLLSSFLNPNANKREDEYGGISLENRSRIIHEVLDAVHTSVASTHTTTKGSSPHFCIGIKLNSADFSKNGFTLEECLEVAASLDSKVDFLEVSGGNYESPSMMLGPTGLSDMTSLSSLGHTTTQIREAYFVEFSKQIKQKSIKRAAVMVTGGMRSKTCMDKALQNEEADLIGVSRPVCGNPYCVGKLLHGEIEVLPSYENTLELPKWARWTTKIIIGNLITVGSAYLWFYECIIRMSKGEELDYEPNLFGVMSRFNEHENSKAAQLKIEGIEGMITNNPPKKSSGAVKNVAVASVAVVAVAVMIRRFR